MVNKKQREFVEKILYEPGRKAEPLPFDAVKVDLKNLLLELREQFRNFMFEKELKIEIAVEDSAPNEVVSDKFRLGWVLKYLLLNACSSLDRGEVKCRIFRYRGAMGQQKAIPGVGLEIRSSGEAVPASGYKVALEAFRVSTT